MKGIRVGKRRKVSKKEVCRNVKALRRLSSSELAKVQKAMSAFKTACEAVEVYSCPHTKVRVQIEENEVEVSCLHGDVTIYTGCYGSVTYFVAGSANSYGRTHRAHLTVPQLKTESGVEDNIEVSREELDALTPKILANPRHYLLKASARFVQEAINKEFLPPEYEYPKPEDEGNSQ